jgi:putative tRNA adenosine deaminase-associated protein
MSSFATLLVRDAGRWHGTEISLADCESVGDIADLALDEPGELRLVMIEEDDEYAAIVRVDEDTDATRAFLTDGHAADSYSLAAAIAEDLAEIRTDGADGGEELEDAPAAHESVPFGEADIVEDLGTSAHGLLGMCAQEGTLPIDVLVAVCDKAGCGDMFDELRE